MSKIICRFLRENICFLLFIPWMREITKRDKIGGERIRGNLGIPYLAEKMKENVFR